MKLKIKDLMERSLPCKDMLVRLYELPKNSSLMEKLASEGISIRRALIPEKSMVIDWVTEKFSKGWADECHNGFSSHPVCCYVAIKNNQIIGVGVYNSISLGVAGPIGIDENFRGKELGKALLIEMLSHMRAQGYAYAVIGWVAPKTQEFFQKAVNAEVIKRSSPLNGMYAGMLVE